MKAVEFKFRDRIDDLTQENSQLRKKLLLKAGELGHYKSAIESRNSRTLQNYREKVVKCPGVK